MNKLKMQSMDVTGSNVEKIRALFPHCVTERKGENGELELAVDFEKLQLELSNDIIAEGEERYQFTWPEKRKAIREANVITTSTLRPCREESVDFDTTENLYIEGDNLEVLKVLRETYLGKVKMARTPFSLLSRIAVWGVESMDEKEITQKLLKEHRKALPTLLGAPIPFSRKVLSVMFAVSFPFSKWLLSKFKSKVNA